MIFGAVLLVLVCLGLGLRWVAMFGATRDLHHLETLRRGTPEFDRGPDPRFDKHGRPL